MLRIYIFMFAYKFKKIVKKQLEHSLYDANIAEVYKKCSPSSKFINIISSDNAAPPI